uniref:Uncharacterized protein n=1 Tax=Meloidogyne enterolobii TaxID=390850 RepID=A0A6V7UX36_MELEN|nr:unnamed protein product [Meloidogyne enterolobii]
MKLKNGLVNPIPLYLPNQNLDKNIIVCLSKGQVLFNKYFNPLKISQVHFSSSYLYKYDWG